jgi:hypothetical protein
VVWSGSIAERVLILGGHHEINSEMNREV